MYVGILPSLSVHTPPAILRLLQSSEVNHYATLGLDRSCTEAQVRAAYWLLAKQHHPDVNPDSPEAMERTQAINAAYEILSDPVRRRDYDHELDLRKKRSSTSRKSVPNVSQDVHLRIEEFLRGAKLEVRVNEAGQQNGTESYELVVPPETAPGKKLRVVRDCGGFVLVKLRVRPDFRFKARGSDLRCDLRISFERARKGGTESVRGATGSFIRVSIPSGVAVGEVIRILGEGLPKARGGRGDLLVRIMYRPEVRITRK